MVEGCRATNAGGGVHATLNVSIRLKGAAVRGNAAGANGGAFALTTGPLNLTNSAVYSNVANSATVTNGGGAVSYGLEALLRHDLAGGERGYKVPVYAGLTWTHARFKDIVSSNSDEQYSEVED